MDAPEVPDGDLPHPAPKRRPTQAEIYADGPSSLGGRMLFVSVFLAGAALLVIVWISIALPLFQQPPHGTAICYGKLHGCLSFSAGDEWVTEAVETVVLWGGAGLFGYGAVRVMRSPPPRNQDTS
jgi:hypothetical protein